MSQVLRVVHLECCSCVEPLLSEGSWQGIKLAGIPMLLFLAHFLSLLTSHAGCVASACFTGHPQTLL